MFLLILLLLQSLNLVLLLLLLLLLALRRRVGAYSTPRASGDWYSPRTQTLQTLRPEADLVLKTIQTMQRQSRENWNHLISSAWTNRARPLAR
jgi:hypothetical protein